MKVVDFRQACEPIEVSDITISEDQKDLYGNLQVSNPFTVFDVTFENHKQIDLWEVILAGGASEGYLADKGVRTLTTGTASGDKATLVQHGYNQFLEGKELELNLISELGPQKAGLQTTYGMFDNLNGCFFRQTEDNVFVEVRSNVSGTPTIIASVQRADWEDPLDGTGPSGLDIDLTQFGRLFIKTQGVVGVTTFGIDMGGKFIDVQSFNFSFSQMGAYIERASLPVRWEIENIDIVADATTVEIQGCSVKSHGGYDLTGFPFSASGDTTARMISSRISILALRVKTLFGPGVKTPRGVIKLTDMGIGVSGGDILWEIVLQKGYLGEANLGGSPTWNGINRSTMEFALDGTTTTGGETLASGYAIADTGNNPGNAAATLSNIVHNIALDDAGLTSDFLHLVATPVGNNATILRSLGWREFK